MALQPALAIPTQPEMADKRHALAVANPQVFLITLKSYPKLMYYISQASAKSGNSEDDFRGQPW